MTQTSAMPNPSLTGSAPVGPGGPSAAPIRALVVDDSVVMRRLISRMLASDPGIEVVGSARDGVDALKKIEQLRPDLVTLDVEMPEMDGLEALRLIQQRYPKIRVIMCSSLTARGAAVTIDALLSGASDYVTKEHSSLLGESAYEPLRVELLAKIGHIFRRRSAPAAVASAATAPTVAAVAVPGPAAFAGLPAATPRKAVPPEILAIGVSTGGPAALAEIMPMVPANFPLPIVIVQHMPPFFTQLLAERLDRVSNITVREGTHGMELQAGMAVLAPGNFHMRVVRSRNGIAIELNQQEQENSCRPAVDVLFRSVADTYGGAAIAMILTGMGQDGLLGAGVLKDRGAPVLVQDSATSVVWGMPGAVANAKLADAILPLKEVVPEVLRRL